MRTIPIIINVRSDGIDVTPTYVNVPNGNTEVKLRWTVVNGTFAASTCFKWKNSPTGAPSVSCPSSPGAITIESASYVNDAKERRVWQYAVTIVADGKEVTIDPEVNNEPPTP